MSPAANDPLSTGPANFREMSEDSQRTVDDPSPRSPSATPRAATRIRCPHCHNPIQLADNRSDEVLCPVCGSNFRVQDTRITTTTSGMRQLGKFQLLERVGVGGFGAVWKARDTELDRLVALKLAHAGLLESDADRQRFFREARAAAQLRHPNIVTVHEVASLDGLPALVAEFVEGVSLRDYLQAKKFTFREAAALIAQLADALDYAHSLGIVHRDVKPGNVMLAEPKSRASGLRSPESGVSENNASSSLTPDSCSLTPLVMDFGLALRPEAEVTLTIEGQVLGTPAYMSPEQASGKGHGADRRSDVYSLGVVLYEMLAGELPFRGSKMMILHQVLHDEPRPPRRLNDKVPRDLQTICLKAMAKAPARRYATARALADDLRRFLRGEPIEARPVGRWERAAKWVRRNPTLAAATAAVAAVLLAGTAASIYFGFDAKGQAELARSNEADALAARNDLAESNATLTRTTDQLETAVARSLLRPLGARGPQAHRPTPLTDAEVEALWELASTPQEGLRLRFIAEGLGSPATTRQLRSRAALAVHAAVGLDRRRRREVERLLTECMTAEATPEGQRIDLALALAALDDLGASGASGAAAVLTRAMAGTADLETLVLLSDGLSALVERMEPGQAAAALTQVAAALPRAMGTGRGDSNTQLAEFRFSENLSAVAARVEPGQAATIFTQAMAATKDGRALRELSLALWRVAERMEPAKAAQACGRAATILTQNMDTTKDANALQWLPGNLEVVSGWMEPGQAADILIQNMNTTKDAQALHTLSRGLSGVAARMEPGKATQACAQAAAILIQAMNTTKTANAKQQLSLGLSAVAARMEPGQAAQAAASLIQAMNTIKEGWALQSLSGCLSAVAARMEPAKAAEVCARAAATLIQAINTPRDANAPQDRFALLGLSRGLSAVAAHMEPDKAAEAAAALTQVINTIKDDAWGQLSLGLSALAARMEPGKAATSLIRAMSTTKDAYALGELSKGLSGVAARMEPGKAAQTWAQAAAILTQNMISTKDASALQAFSGALSAVVERMEPDKAAEACAQAAATLTRAMTTTKDAYVLQGLSRGLSEVAARVEAAKAAAILIQAMTTTKDAHALGQLSLGLSAVAARMEPAKAAEACAQAASTLSQAITKNANALEHRFALQGLSGALSAVAARMEPDKAAATLIQAMTTTKDAIALWQLSLGLSAVAARMEPGQAAQACAQAAAILSQAIRSTQETNMYKDRLLEGLSAVAERMEPDKAAAILTQAMTTTKNTYGWCNSSLGLSAVAARMEPDKAAQACALAASTLPQNPSPTKERFAPQELSQGLSALLVGVDHLEQRRRAVALTGALGRAAGGYGPPACLPLLQPAPDPLPCRLSTQQLVELLKHPLFVNQARRIVLDQLGRRYGRRFADVWEFVAWAREHEPTLDLTTPPQRPRR